MINSNLGQGLVISNTQLESVSKHIQVGRAAIWNANKLRGSKLSTEVSTPSDGDILVWNDGQQEWTTSNSIPGITTGIYVPSVTSNATLIPFPEANNAYFTKINNILTIAGKLSIDEWNGGTTKNFNISLPLGYSVSLSGVEGLTGICTGSSSAGSIVGISNNMIDPTIFELKVSQGGPFPTGNNAGVLKYTFSFICDQ